ncbi:MAG: hypothetical protein IKU29_00785 [Parabacteroides sp.]|nr:hypothetical protein [Parabacteroides sp.]
MDNVKSIIELLLEEHSKCQELRDILDKPTAGAYHDEIITLKAVIRNKRSEISKCFNSDLKYNID